MSKIFQDGFLSAVGRFEQTRWPWLVIAILSAGLVLIAHNVFQVWLYMKPCEQCVYIRFAFLCMTFGCLFALAAPKNLIARLIAYVCGVFGCIYGLMCSFKLESIHKAVHSDDPAAMFGMQGCSLQPHYPFGLPLEKWAPDWFLPTGDCGYDNCDVPLDAVLSPAQQFFVDLYNNAGGWYLLPPYKFMSMAQCCILGFGVALLIYIVLFSGMAKKLLDAKKSA